MRERRAPDAMEGGSATAGGGGYRGRWDASLDSQLLQTVPKGVGMESQDLGRAAGAVDDPVRLVQNRGNVVPLNGLQTRTLLARRDRARRRQNAWFDLEDAVRLEDDSPLKDVFQLADVTGPAIREELLHGALADALDALAEPNHEIVEEKVHEERDVFGAIAERREMNGEDVESVVKILAEGFFLNRFQ